MIGLTGASYGRSCSGMVLRRKGSQPNATGLGRAKAVKLNMCRLGRSSGLRGVPNKEIHFSLILFYFIVDSLAAMISHATVWRDTLVE
jgi:hypothetical protein